MNFLPGNPAHPAKSIFRYFVTYRSVLDNVEKAVRILLPAANLHEPVLQLDHADDEVVLRARLRNRDQRAVDFAETLRILAQSKKEPTFARFQPLCRKALT